MPLHKELKKVGRKVEGAAKSVGHMVDGRGRHNFIPYELESRGIVVVCSYCGWKKEDCKNKKNCSGNPDGPYAKLLTKKLGKL